MLMNDWLQVCKGQAEALRASSVGFSGDCEIEEALSDIQIGIDRLYQVIDKDNPLGVTLAGEILACQILGEPVRDVLKPHMNPNISKPT
jgi:hypothetical protein